MVYSLKHFVDRVKHVTDGDTLNVGANMLDDNM